MNSLKMLLLLAFTSLMACSHSQDNNDNPAYAPVVNPNPKYYMTIDGHIDPGLSKIINLRLKTFYVTHNEKCQYDVTNGIEGAMSPRHQWLISPIYLDKIGNFKKQIPLDYFLPGVCGWSISYIEFENAKAVPIFQSVQIISFDPTAIYTQFESGEMTLKCSAEGCSLMKFKPIGKNSMSSYSIENNYSYHLNIIN